MLGLVAGSPTLGKYREFIPAVRIARVLPSGLTAAFYRLACNEVRIIGEAGVQYLLDGVRQGRWCYEQARRRSR
jgi:hypothetical protein